MNKNTRVIIFIIGIIVFYSLLYAQTLVPPVLDVRGNAGVAKKGHVVIYPADLGLDNVQTRVSVTCASGIASINSDGTGSCGSGVGPQGPAGPNDISASTTVTGLSGVLKASGGYAAGSATTADLPDSANKRYVTDAGLAELSATTGTNTGDETQASIKTKLGSASSGVDGYLTGTDWTTFNAKLSATGDGSGLTGLVPSTRTVNGQPLSSNVTVTIPTALADLSADSTHRVASDAEKSTWNAKQSPLSAATNTVSGYLSATDHALFNAGMLQSWAALGGALPVANCPPSQALLNAAAALGFDQAHLFCVVFANGPSLTGISSILNMGSLSAFNSISGNATLIGIANADALGTVTGASASPGSVAVFGISDVITLGSLVGHGSSNGTLSGIVQNEVVGNMRPNTVALLDTFTASDNSAISATHWGTQSTSNIKIVSNRAQGVYIGNYSVQGIENLTLNPTTYFKATQSITTLDTNFWILLQNSANIGATTTNSIFLIANYDTGSPDSYYFRVFSYDSSNAGTQMGTSYDCVAGDTLEVRLSSSATQVSIYKNGSFIAGPFTHTATLGSTVKVKFQVYPGHWVDNIEVGAI